MSMHFKVGGPGHVILALPAWSPGHYVLLWFARRVSGFTPTQNGTAIPWHQLDFQTWQLDSTKPGADVTVSFDYLADTIDRAVAWTQPNFAFFNGTNVFMYPVGRGFKWPAQVVIHTQHGWRIATGMTALPTRHIGGMHHDYDIEYVYAAPNYHDLVDFPFFIGRFDLDSTAVSLPGEKEQHWVRAATYPMGTVTGPRMTRLLGWLAKLAAVEGGIFHEIPWKTYTVLQIADTAPNGGGLEHQNSQLDELTPSQLDVEWLPWLYSHEMFHSWNVKRLRPSDLVPYRYDDAQPTPWLWVSEGVTDYYADVAVARSGIGDSTALLARSGRVIAQIAGATPTALSDASLRAWIAPTDGSAGIYYPKGALAGFLLDILIRDASDNHHSLDDVMRSLYDSTYKHGRGFSSQDWWTTVAREAAPGTPAIPFAEVQRRYIDGRDPLPWDVVLPLAGLRVAADTVRAVRLGLGTDYDTNGVHVTFLDPAGAAAAGGMKIGDLLTSIGDIPMRNDSSFERVRVTYASSTGTMPATVRRAEQMLTLQLPIRTAPEVHARLEPASDASPKAARVRHGLLSGVTGP